MCRWRSLITSAAALSWRRAPPRRAGRLLQRTLVRERLGVVCDPQRARAVAVEAIGAAALVKNNPPDLINVALEMLVKSSLELPGFWTLDEMAARIRHEVNTTMFERVGARIALPDRVGLEDLLEVDGPGAKSAFSRLKRVAGRASWSAFREQVAHLRWVDSLGDSEAWLEGIAEPKIADFAGEAMAADAGVMRDVAPSKRTALLACMVHVARTRARDDLAEMFRAARRRPLSPLGAPARRRRRLLRRGSTFEALSEECRPARFRAAALLAVSGVSWLYPVRGLSKKSR